MSSAAHLGPPPSLHLSVKVHYRLSKSIVHCLLYCLLFIILSLPLTFLSTLLFVRVYHCSSGSVAARVTLLQLVWIRCCPKESATVHLSVSDCASSPLSTFGLLLSVVRCPSKSLFVCLCYSPCQFPTVHQGLLLSVEISDCPPVFFSPFKLAAVHLGLLLSDKI